MSENTNTLALSIENVNVAAVVKDGKAGRIVYKKYVAEFGISTKEQVSEHVAALTELAGYKADEKADRKRFQMRVRAGLNYYVKSDETEATETVKDYLAAILSAIDTGVTHNLNADDIRVAVNEHIASLLK